MGPVFSIPGYGGSGPDHWQTHWERLHPEINRIEQSDWIHAKRSDWEGNLVHHLEMAKRPVILLAHSMGCLLVLQTLQGNPGLRKQIAGAFLVAPPDPSSPAFPVEPSGFSEIPTKMDGVQITIVVSDDDPYASVSFSENLARACGADLKILRARGHLNATSIPGAWEEGWEIFQSFRNSLI